MNGEESEMESSRYSSSESERESSDVDEDNDESEGESSNSEEEMSSDELEDNVAYRKWHAEAIDATSDAWTDKYEKYIQAGMNEKDAKEKAYMKTMWTVKRFFYDSYQTFLIRNVELKDDDTHQDILAAIEEKLDKGIDVSTAVKRVVVKHRAQFEALFQENESDDNLETDASEDSNA